MNKTVRKLKRGSRELMEIGETELGDLQRLVPILKDTLGDMMAVLAAMDDGALDEKEVKVLKNIGRRFLKARETYEDMVEAVEEIHATIGRMLEIASQRLGDDLEEEDEE